MIVQGTSVGLDVHALSVVAHAIDEETGKVARARLCPDHREVLGWLHQLRAPVRVTYEAGPDRRSASRGRSTKRRDGMPGCGAVEAATPGRGSGQDRLVDRTIGLVSAGVRAGRGSTG